MNKPYSVIVKRRSFVQLCRSNPKEGAEYLHKVANKMAQSKKTPEVIRCLESILFLHETTIYRDL